MKERIAFRLLAMAVLAVACNSTDKYEMFEARDTSDPKVTYEVGAKVNPKVGTVTILLRLREADSITVAKVIEYGGKGERECDVLDERNWTCSSTISYPGFSRSDDVMFMAIGRSDPTILRMTPMRGR